MIIASCASKCIFVLVQVLWNLQSPTKLPPSTTVQYCIWADPVAWVGMFVIAFEAEWGDSGYLRTAVSLLCRSGQRQYPE